LIATIKKLGGKPVEEKNIEFYKKSLEVSPPCSRIKNGI
jgi:hypothetical protein